MTRLNHLYGKASLLFASISCMIGSGWLLSAQLSYQLAGAGAVYSWILGSGIILVFAFCFSAVAIKLPITGGIGRYIAITHGNDPSYLIAWLAWLSCVAVAPTEVRTIMLYANELSSNIPLFINNQLTVYGGIVAILLMIVMTGINLKGIKLLIRCNQYIALWKLTIPLVIALYIGSHGINWSHFSSSSQLIATPHGWQGVFEALSTVVVFSFLGFREVSSLAGETQNPQKSIPFAIITSVAFCTFAYLLFQIIYIGAMPDPNVMSSNEYGPWAHLAKRLGLTWIQLLLYIDLIISPGGAGIMYTATTSRLTYAMANINALPKRLSKLNRFSVPHESLLFNCVFGCLLIPYSWESLVKFQSVILIVAYLAGPLALYSVCKPQERNHKLLAVVSVILCNFIILWSGWHTFSIILICSMILLLLKAILHRSLENTTWFIIHMIIMGIILALSPFQGIFPIFSHTFSHALVVITSFGLLLWTKKAASDEKTILNRLDKIIQQE